MRTIWKYELLTLGETVVDMPDGVEVLHVGNQRDTLVLWALVDASRALRRRRFLSLVTGGDASGIHRAQYLGTVQFQNGYLVAHVIDGGWL